MLNRYLSWSQQVYDLHSIQGYIKEVFSARYGRIGNLNYGWGQDKLTANYSAMSEAVVHYHESGKAIHELLFTHCDVQRWECECRSMPAEFDLYLTTKLFTFTLYPLPFTKRSIP